MIRALLIDEDTQSLRNLKEQIIVNCPLVDIAGVAFSNEQIQSIFQDLKPELVFLEVAIASDQFDSIISKLNFQFETILMYSCPVLNLKDHDYYISGYLQKPIQAKDLVATVQQAQHWLRLRNEQLETRNLLQRLLHQCPPDNIVGIPTMESIEFIKVGNIIRCEGLQRYTRVVIHNSASIISSYSIGLFHKLLLPFGFFSPHKSHLINLCHMKRFLIEGTILMIDNSSVPVARRKRNAFLEIVNHL